MECIFILVSVSFILFLSSYLWIIYDLKIALFQLLQRFAGVILRKYAGKMNASGLWILMQNWVSCHITWMQMNQWEPEQDKAALVHIYIYVFCVNLLSSYLTHEDWRIYSVKSMVREWAKVHMGLKSCQNYDEWLEIPCFLIS